MRIGKVAALLASLALVVALAGCSSSSSSSDIPSTGTTPDNSATSAAVATGSIDLGGGSATTAVAPVGLGKPTKSGTWGLTVKNFTFAGDVGGAVAASDDELAIVTFELTNNAAKDAGIGASSFQLSGPEGTPYDPAQTTSADFIYNTAQPIKAGETRTIKMAFNVPAGTKTFKFAFKPFTETGSAVEADVLLP